MSKRKYDEVFCDGPPNGQGNGVNNEPTGSAEPEEEEEIRAATTGEHEDAEVESEASHLDADYLGQVFQRAVDAAAGTGGPTTVNFYYTPTKIDQRQYTKKEFTMKNVQLTRDRLDEIPGTSGISQTLAPAPSGNQSQATQESTSPIEESIPSTSSQITDPQAPDIEQSSDIFDNWAVKRFMEEQNKNREVDVDLQEINVPIENVPEVYPRISEVSFYKAEALPGDENYKPSSQHQQICEVIPENRQLTRNKDVKFKDLLTHSSSDKPYISLIGFPGSGKTTSAKRLAKSSGYLCLLVKLKDTNHEHNYKCTIRQLLIDDVYFDLDAKICEEVFKWIKENQERCLIILDGLDQFTCQLEENPPLKRYEYPQKVSDLVASLCSKKYLSRAHLIITSRPHTMLSLPPDLRPKTTYLLNDLSPPDMKKLHDVLAAEEAPSLWEKLTVSAPQLISLCLCPLMLLLFIKASCRPTRIIESITTMTRIFNALLENLRRSAKNVRHKNLNNIKSKLARLSYRTTLQCRVTLTHKELTNEGLKVEMVQDLVIAVHGNRGSDKSFRVVEGDQKLYFCHQTFQEFLAAFYIAYEMPFNEYKEFIESKLFTDHWMMVRKFLCGILLDIGKSEENNESRRRLLKERIVQKMGEIEKTMGDRGRTLQRTARRLLVDVFTDIRECNNDQLTVEVAKHFPINASFRYIPLSASDIHAIARIFAEITKCVDKINLSDCKMDTEGFRHICLAIQRMPGTIEELIISNNPLGNDALELICSILGKVKTKLRMWSCFLDQEGSWRDANEEEKDVLQQTINQLPNTNLKIEVQGHPEDQYIEQQT